MLSNIGENTASPPQLHLVSLLSCSLHPEALTFPHCEGRPVCKEELGFLSFFFFFFSGLNAFPSQARNRDHVLEVSLAPQDFQQQRGGSVSAPSSMVCRGPRGD